MRAVLFVLLTLILAAVLPAACGPSQEDLDATATMVAAEIFATQTAGAPTPTTTPTQTPLPTNTPVPTNTPTPSPTPSPTVTPTPSATPTPDLLSYLPTEADLPAGFIEVPPDSFGLLGDLVSESGESTAVAFMNLEQPEFLLVFLYSSPSESGQQMFQRLLTDPDALASIFLTGAGLSGIDDERILEYAEIPDIDEVGEESAGVTMAIRDEGDVLRMNLIAFSRGDYQLLIVSVNDDAETSQLQLGEVAGLVDRRLTTDTGQPGTTTLEELPECDDPLGCVFIAPGEPIKLASALVITGRDAPLGLDSQHGIDLALEFRGDVLDHPVEVQHEDEQCNAEGGQNAATKIVSDPQIVAMVGTSCSGAAVPAAQIVSAAGYVMVSPSNTTPALTDPDMAWQPGYLRVSHNDEIQGAAMAGFAYNELGVRKVAAIHDGDPYTERLARAFATPFKEWGGEIVAFEAEASDATDVEPLLTTIAAAEPDLIYYPVFMNLGSLLTNTAAEMEDLEGVILAGADGMLSPSFLAATGEASEGMYFSGPNLRFEGGFYQEGFLPTYVEEFGMEPTAVFHAHAFDAINMILDAIEEVAQQAADGSLLIGRQALRDALYATDGFEGITGTLSCDAFGDCAATTIVVIQVQNGEFVRIWP